MADSESKAGCCEILCHCLVNKQLLETAADGDFENAKQALESGGSLACTDANKNTPLMLAAANTKNKGAISVVELLLDQKAEVNSTNKCGATALMAAAASGNTRTMRLLIEASADHAMCDQSQCTALMVAANAGHTDVIQLLLDAGADTSVVNADGRTALDLARECGHVAAAEAIHGGPIEVLQSSESGVGSGAPSPQDMTRDVLGRAALIPLACVLCCEAVVPSDCDWCTLCWDASCCDHPCWDAVCCCFQFVHHSRNQSGFHGAVDVAPI